DRFSLCSRKASNSEDSSAAATCKSTCRDGRLSRSNRSVDRSSVICLGSESPAAGDEGIGADAQGDSSNTIKNRSRNTKATLRRATAFTFPRVASFSPPMITGWRGDVLYFNHERRKAAAKMIMQRLYGLEWPMNPFPSPDGEEYGRACIEVAGV